MTEKYTQHVGDFIKTDDDGITIVNSVYIIAESPRHLAKKMNQVRDDAKNRCHSELVGSGFNDIKSEAKDYLEVCGKCNCWKPHDEDCMSCKVIEIFTEDSDEN